MALVGSTACKSSQMSRNECTSCKLKWMWPECEVPHVRQPKSLEAKILHVSWNEIERIWNTSCKRNDMARNENTSCKMKRNGWNRKYFM